MFLSPVTASYARPVLKVLTTFDPTIWTVAERVHEFESQHGCWVDWDMMQRGDVEAIVYEWLEQYDVISVDEPWIPSLSGHLRPLKDWTALESGERDRHPLATWQGQCYGRLMLENIYLYAYRADVFADPRISGIFESSHGRALTAPQSLDAFLEVAAFFIAASEFHGLAAVETPREAVVIDLLWCLQSSGVELSDWNTHSASENEALLLGLKRFREMHALSLPTKRPLSLGDVNEAYARGEVAQVVQWSGLSKELKNPLFSRIGTKTRFAPLPGAATGEGFCITGHWFLSIPRTTEEPSPLAAAFIDWYFETAKPEVHIGEDLDHRFDDVRRISRPRSEQYPELSHKLYQVALQAMDSQYPLPDCARRLALVLDAYVFTTTAPSL